MYIFKLVNNPKYILALLISSVSLHFEAQVGLVFQILLILRSRFCYE